MLFWPKSRIHTEQFTAGGYPHPFTPILRGAVLVTMEEEEEEETVGVVLNSTWTWWHSQGWPVHPSLQELHEHSLIPATFCGEESLMTWGLETVCVWVTNNVSGAHHPALRGLGLVVAVEGAEGGVHHHQGKEDQGAQACDQEESGMMKV